MCRHRTLIARQLIRLLMVPILLLSGAGSLSAGTVIEHVVQSGETLTAIAGQYNVTVSKIMQENNIRDQNRVTTGQRLRITLADAPATAVPTATPDAPDPTATPADSSKGNDPPPTAAPTQAADQPTDQPTNQPTATPERAQPTATPRPVRGCNSFPGSGEIAYTVRQGDTLSGIAAGYRTSISVLRSRNCLASDLLIVGQRLIVPYGGGGTSNPTPTVAPTRGTTPPARATATPTRVRPSPTPRPTATPTPAPAKEDGSWWDRLWNK